MPTVLRRDQRAIFGQANPQRFVPIQPVTNGWAAPSAPREAHSPSTHVAQNPAARIDVCRLFVALFGLTLYLGLPIAGLAYMGFRLIG